MTGMIVPGLRCFWSPDGRLGTLKTRGRTVNPLVHVFQWSARRRGPACCAI
jgi:hypothetical protein